MYKVDIYVMPKDEASPVQYTEHIRKLLDEELCRTSYVEQIVWLVKGKDTLLTYQYSTLLANYSSKTKKDLTSLIERARLETGLDVASVVTKAEDIITYKDFKEKEDGNGQVDD